MIWFTSDLHFSHKNIIKYCNRPYSSVGEMNAALIKNFDECVAIDDTVFNLGDMFMGRGDNIEEICGSLLGKMTLIKGNHDYEKRLAKIKAAGINVEDQLITRTDIPNLCLFMIHDPDGVDFDYLKEMTDSSGQDFIVLYGHVHDNAPKEMEKVAPHIYKFHVGVDTNGYKPVSWDSIKAMYLELKGNE